MNKSSEVDQPHPLRIESAPPQVRPTTRATSASSNLQVQQALTQPTERELRREKRNQAREELFRAHSQPSNMTITEVQRPLTSTQQRNLRASEEPDRTVTNSGNGGPRRNPPGGPPGNPFGDPSGDPDGDPNPDNGENPPRDNPPAVPRGGPGGDPEGPGDPDGDPDDEPDPSEPQGSHRSEAAEEEFSRRDLQQVIKSLVGKDKGKKPAFKPKQPDTFNGGTPQQLRTFIFQCKLFFNSSREDFAEDTDKINFAISYLRGPALDYFEPFINEPDPDDFYDFLFDWDKFVQKLANLFGSFSPEDDDEDAITAITFPHDGKATSYFIEFAKYQSRIKWDNRALRKVVKDAIPARISREIPYSREDTDSFDGYRKAVLRIDNDYWKKKQDDENRLKMMQTLQTRLGKSIAKQDSKKSGNNNSSSSSSNPTNNNNNSGNNNKNQGGKKSSKDKSKSSGKSPASTSTPAAKGEHIGSDGHLTPAERERRVKAGLCLLCGQKGHLVKDCPKSTRSTGSSSKGRAAKAEPEAESSRSKN
jgi:Domain of unknown function (DUF4939)